MANLRAINHPATCFPILFVEDSVLSGGWVPLNPEHFVEKEAFNVQVLCCLKHLDMAAQSSKWSSLLKADWYFTLLRKLLQNDLSTKSYAFNMMILTTALSTSAKETLYTGPKPPQNVEEIQTGIYIYIYMIYVYIYDICIYIYIWYMYIYIYEIDTINIRYIHMWCMYP